MSPLRKIKCILNSRNLRCTLLLSATVATSLMCGMIATAGADASSQAGEGACTQLLISTEKGTYLLDPYYWVYEAPSDLWRSDGYNRTVNFTVLLMDSKGFRAAVENVSYDVSNAATIIASGCAYDRGDGLYTASFEITDDDAGGVNFNGSYPVNFMISVEAESSGTTIKGSKTFMVGRWGCDRCHIEKSLAETIYPWSWQSGSGGGHDGGRGGMGSDGEHRHSWTDVLGRSGDRFDLSHLIDSELTHTPEAYLNVYPYHEQTRMKGGGKEKCSPCHQGSGRVRDETTIVECTFCHGIDQGYNAYWQDSAGYAYGVHRNVEPSQNTDFADQSCSNSSCHGHITDSKPGEIDNAYPNCSSCHPISFGSEVPQWLDISTGHPRDVGGHPDGESIVNCSFCHNSFHSLFDESDVLSCGDCHPESENYPQHPYAGYRGGATCANCHSGSGHLNIHEISVPGCGDCHSKVFDDIKEGYDYYAMDDDPANLAPNGSKMTHKRDTIVSLLFGGSDPQGLSGIGSYFYSRHAYPDSSGGWQDATGPERTGDQVCINCHSEIVRNEGVLHDENWGMVTCKPCHDLWNDAVYGGTPNVHYLSSPHCTDCHTTCSWHAGISMQNPPKDYARAPAISLMLEDSVHERLVMNTTTGNPSNYLGCLICHTGVDFNIYYDDAFFEITIMDYGGVHRWSSMPSCTRCHSLDDNITSLGPGAYGHERLDIGWDNNTQCLICHNIYNQTAGRYHGHNVTIESCVGCHYNATAMNDYGTPAMYVYGNESMGDACADCHNTTYHPPSKP